MKIFKREVTKEDNLLGKVYNSFYKTGFMNEDVYFSKSRDLFPYVLELLTDTNTASVFENIAVAYQEVPYSESILQQLLSREFKDSIIHKHNIETYVSTNLLNLKFYRFLFIQNPSSIKNDKKMEILNTIKALKENYKDFTLVDSVMDFLEDQLNIHTFNNKNTNSNLIHENDLVTLVIPQLIDNRYYNTNGIKRFPYFTEEYLHIKTRLGQLTFLFKTKMEKPSNSDKKKYHYIKKESFFDTGEYVTMNGEVKNIFYVKILNKFYNPFMFFDIPLVNQLLNELEDEVLLKPIIKEYLKNTYECYIEEYDAVRSVYGNLVPNIIITKENDSYYDDMRERLKKLEEMSIQYDKLDEDGDIEETDNDDIFDPIECSEEDTDDEYDSSDEHIKDNGSYTDEIEYIRNMLKERDKILENKNNKNSTFRLSRNALSIKKLKSLIMGFNGEKKFGYYPHLSDLMLKYTDLNDVKISNGIIENPKQFPKSFQIIKMISNDELFCTDDSTHPLDWLMPFMYRKTLIQANETGTSTTTDIYIPPQERYLSKAEFGLIDPHTKKSESAAGLLSSINPFITIKNRVEVK